ncbi:MAG: RluA family pseudouridine synthase, partial [Acetatifactor sp.]|nr:RluA family pseudouridine synthase [Acetatifactor sp.]
RFDKFLGKLLPEAPVSFFYKMLRKKNITLNGKKAEGKELLQLKDQVTLWLADETILKFGGYLPKQELADGQTTTEDSHPGAEGRCKGEALYRQAYRRLQDIKVLYEDAHVLILDKPAGVLTQQAKEGDLSLNEWMIGYLLNAGAITAQELRLFKPSVCNRLDRNTSGLVLCGKSLPGSQALSELIRSRAVRKFYRTICVGKIEAADFGAETEIQGYMQIAGYLQKDSRTNQVTVCRQGPGEYIQTAYQPVRQYCIPAKALSAVQMIPDALQGQEELCFTELDVELITGKTHQIRAHLASIGHPLIGDSKYGDTRVNQLLRQRFGLRWQLLHAYQLQFPTLEGVLTPLSGRSIQAPLPAYFNTILGEMMALSQETTKFGGAN